MNLSDLTSVISKEVMPDIWESFFSSLCEESQHLSVVVQELLLGGNSSSTKLLLEELKELLIFLWWDWDLGSDEGIIWAGEAWWL